MHQEIEKKNKKIDILLNSKSWKITKPLRKFKSIQNKKIKYYKKIRNK